MWNRLAKSSILGNETRQKDQQNIERFIYSGTPISLIERDFRAREERMARLRRIYFIYESVTYGR